MRTTLHRPLKPRTPLDCPACRLACAHSTAVGPAPASVRPWREMKSRRGVPKRIPTDGFACPNRQCPYFGITDASIHALVGDGKHGHVERIQTFRCQACRSTFSARRDTPLYRLKTPSQQVAVMLAALAEGLDASAAERVFGYRQATITSWLTRAGEHAQSLHERCFHTLQIPHLQLDHCCEPGCAATSRCCGCGWPLILSPRFFRRFSSVLEPKTWRIASSIPCDRSWPPFCLPLFTSDGLNLYFYALTAHFGHWREEVGRKVLRWQVAAGLIYGQVKKCYRRRKLVRVKHVMRLGTQTDLAVALQGMGFGGAAEHGFHRAGSTDGPTWNSCAGSSHLGHSAAVPTSVSSLEWWRAYYHFVRPHHSLRVALVQPCGRGGKLIAQRYFQRTPAMAAGRTHRRWTACEVLSYPLPPLSA